MGVYGLVLRSEVSDFLHELIWDLPWCIGGILIFSDTLGREVERGW